MAILTSCQATFTDMASIEVGGRNLVLHSDTEVTFKNNYKLYELSEYGKQIVSGRIIIFSLDACSDTDGVTIDVYLRQIVDEVGSSCNEVVASIKNVGTTYKRYSIAVKIKESDYIMHAAVRSNAKSGDGYSTTATVSAKNIKVEIGDVATDWTLAPEDVDEDISQVEQSKNRVWYQTSAPSGTSHRVNDVWFDTDNNNAMYMWDGSSWVLKTFGTTAISDDAITTAKIFAGAVTASEIAAGAITTDKLAANAVTAAKINVDDLFAQDITATGTISGLKLRGEDIDIQSTYYKTEEKYYISSIQTQLVEDNECIVLSSASRGNDTKLQVSPYNVSISNELVVSGGITLGGSSFYIDPNDTSVSYQLSFCQIISPTDTNKWTAYKYSDGRLRCVVQYPVENVNISTSASGWYVTSSAVFKGSSNPYPVEFKSSTTPNVQFTFTTSNTAALTWVTSAGSTTNPPDCSLIRMARATGVYGHIHIVAEGYWK